MEQEQFFTGYCRAADHSRTVMAVTENGQLQEVDCGFGRCPHEGVCPIGQKIREELT